EREVRVDLLAVAEREARGDEGARKTGPPGDPYAHAVAEGAPAAFGCIELTAERIPDDGGGQRIAFAGRDRDAPERKARDEVGRPVEWIDDPLTRALRAGASSSLLRQKGVVGEALPDRGDDPFLALAIRVRHEIVLLLLLDRSVWEIAPVPQQDLS